MAYKDFMQKVRHWDNLTAKWFLRHFYFMFFQIVLIVVFIFWFINLFSLIDSIFHAGRNNLEQILLNQSVNTTILVFLLLLNSFWLLFIFNGMQRVTTLLKDISYYTSRSHHSPKTDSNH